MAIRGSRNLSIDYILQNVDSYQAYAYYCPVPFTLNKPFCNPFRGEKDPSMIIGTKSGKIGHFDFADPYYKGGFIDFVMQAYRCDLNTAINKIAKDFGIGGFNSPDPKIKYIEKLQADPPKPTLIQVKTKSFDKQSLTYWNNYHLDIYDLRREKIYYIDKLWINRKLINIPITELAFAYEYENGEYWKIYRPNAKNKKSKWLSNVPIDLTDGLEEIVNCEKVVVTKSKKDKAVIKKFFSSVFSVQNESLAAINSFTSTWLNKEAKEVYVNYDSDEPGKKNSLLVTETYKWNHINVPDEYYLNYGIKDFADLAKEKGLDVVIEYFKSKKLL